VSTVTVKGFDLLAAWTRAAEDVDLGLEYENVTVTVTDSGDGTVRFAPNVPIVGVPK